MRLFAAIDIDSHVRKRIANVQDRLKRELNLRGHQVKWVRPDLIHLTVKFLGEVPDKDVTRVCDVVTRTAAEFSGFDLQVRGMGVFGRPARVVWVGCEPCPALTGLQNELEEQFDRIGWPKENRPFAGHLTLCRIKSVAAGKQLSQAVEAYKDEVFGTISVTELLLFESRLSSTGPEYTVVCTGTLK